MFKSFIKKIIHLFRQNCFKTEVNKSVTSSWFIFSIVLLSACAPSTEGNNVGAAGNNVGAAGNNVGAAGNNVDLAYPNTLNSCVQQVIDHHITTSNGFENCVEGANQRLSDDIREEIIRDSISASDSELQTAAEIIVTRQLQTDQDYTKTELVDFMIEEIEIILGPDEDNKY